MAGSTKDRKVPDSEHIPDHLLHRDRTPAGPRRGPVNWPASFRGLYTKARDGWLVSPSTGSVGGTPMQLGDPIRRTTLKARESEHHPIVKLRVPKPALGFWWTTGHPSPRDDKHATLVDPVSGDVYEFIQFHDNVLVTALPWLSHCMGYGVWRDGQLVEGRATTATKLPRFKYLWTPWSVREEVVAGLVPFDPEVDGHVGAVVYPDYQYADGLLTTGPKAGALYVLDRGSASYRDMKALGGWCAATAESHATFGFRAIDRNSYSDVPAHERMVRIGEKPHEPTIEIQPAGQWEGSNLGEYRIHLLDLLEVA